MKETSGRFQNGLQSVEILFLYMTEPLVLV